LYIYEIVLLVKQDFKKKFKSGKKDQKNRFLEKQENQIKLTKVFLTRSKARLEASVGSSDNNSINEPGIYLINNHDYLVFKILNNVLFYLNYFLYTECF
jgi:hypothetical protein